MNQIKWQRGLRHDKQVNRTLCFLLNGVKVNPLSTMNLLRAHCLTPIKQLSVRSECYLYSYHSAMVIGHDVYSDAFVSNFFDLCNSLYIEPVRPIIHILTNNFPFHSCKYYNGNLPFLFHFNFNIGCND